MGIHDERDDLADDGDVTVHRERAKTMLDQIAAEVKQTLIEQGIDLSLFFLIPSSGDSVLIFGTPADPSDGEWNRVAEIVAPIVRQSVGMAGTRCRAVACATTQDQESHDAIA